MENKIVVDSLNPYEDMHDQLKGTPLYQELGGDQGWKQYARRGDLNTYITILNDQDKLGGVENFANKYETKYLDTDQKLQAVANELYADRTTLNKYKETYIDEATGEEKEREVEMTEYDYNRKMIDNVIQYEKEKYQLQVEQKEKEDMNGFVKFLASGAGIALRAVSAFVSQADNIFDSFVAMGKTTIAGVTEDSTDHLRQTFQEEDWVTDFADWVAEFERKYTYNRDIYGNYVGVGGILSDLADSFGKAAMNMIINKISGGIGGTTGKIMSKASNFLYWEGLSAGNFREMVNDPEMASVPTMQLVLNSAMIGTAEWLVQQGLNSILGSSMVDDLVFGSKATGIFSKLFAKTAGKSALVRIGTKIGLDALHEGVEEAMQEYADYLVNNFSASMNENFGKYANITLKDMGYAFLLGALSSIGGASIRLTTNAFKTEYTNEPKLNKDGTVKRDRKGNVVMKRFNPLRSIVNGFDIQSFTEYSQKIINDANLTNEQRAAALGQMAVTYKAMSSYYGAIGEENFKRANDLLVQLKESEGRHMLNDVQIRNIARQMISDYNLTRTSYYAATKDNIANAIVKAKITQIDQVVERGDVKSGTLQLPSDKAEVEQAIQQIFDKDKSVDRVVVTKDGIMPIQVENIVFVPSNYLELGADGNIVYRTIAEQNLVENVKNASELSPLVKVIVDAYKKVKGDLAIERTVQSTEQEIQEDSTYDERLKKYESDLKAWNDANSAYEDELKAYKDKLLQYEEEAKDYDKRLNKYYKDKKEYEEAIRSNELTESQRKEQADNLLSDIAKLDYKILKLKKVVRWRSENDNHLLYMEPIVYNIKAYQNDEISLFDYITARDELVNIRIQDGLTDADWQYAEEHRNESERYIAPDDKLTERNVAEIRVTREINAYQNGQVLIYDEQQAKLKAMTDERSAKEELYEKLLSKDYVANTSIQEPIKPEEPIAPIKPSKPEIERPIKPKKDTKTITKKVEKKEQVKANDDTVIEQAIYELFFNPQFFEICLSTANQDMYKLLSRLDQIEKSAVDNTVKDAIYKQRIKEVQNEMRVVLINYLINQQEASFDNLTFLTKAQKKFVHDKRWNKDLANRIIKGNKVTDEEFNSIKNRINSLPIPQSQKDVIWTNLHSKTEGTRRNAFAQLNNFYRNVFFSPYDGKTYLPSDTVPNATWNAWAKAADLTIDTLMVPITDPDLYNIVLESQGSVGPESQIAYYKNAFEQYTGNKYTFDYKNGRVLVKEKSSDIQQGYNLYNTNRNDIYQGKTTNKTLVTPKENAARSIVSNLIDKNLDKVSSAYLEIDDIIHDPSLLSDNIRKQIESSPYKVISPQNVFLYLREKILKDTKGTTSIALDRNGKFYLVNVSNMLDTLKNKKQTFNTDKLPKISDIVNGDFLYGRLADVKLKWSNRSEYDATNNTIYLDENSKSNSQYMRFAFLHEFQHAIQAENLMNDGINVNWLHNPSINKTQRSRIISDVRKHKPDLFKNVKVGSQQEFDIAEQFVYDTSAETQSYGLEGNEVNDFYPTLVYTTNEGQFIVMPWGTKYKLGDSTGNVSIHKQVDNENELESILRSNTSDYSLEQFIRRPRSVFVLPNGELRAVKDGTHHVDITDIFVNNGYSKDNSFEYFLNIPQITVQSDNMGDFIGIRIPLGMSKNSIDSLLTIMDSLYNKNIEFDLGPTYGRDVDPSEIVVSSDEYDNADDLLDGYIDEYRASKFMRRSIAQPGLPSSRYVSNKDAQESNLKYFVRKGKPIQMDSRLQSLIKEVDQEQVNKGLWKMIGGSEAGTLNVHKLYEYVRKAKVMNDYTFQLINKHFFQNTAIKTFKQLKAYTDLEVDKYYALRAVLKAFNKESWLEKRLSHKSFTEIIEQLEKRPAWKKLYDHVLKRYQTFRKDLSLDIDRENMRIMFLKNFDGTIDSAAHIAAIARWLAITEYVAKIKYKTPGSTQTISTETEIGEDIKLEDTLADSSSLDAFESVLDEVSEAEMMKTIIEDRNRRFYESEKYAFMDKADIRQAQYEIRQEVEEKLTSEQIRQEYATIMLAEDASENYRNIVKQAVSKVVRPRKNIAENLKRIANVTIAQNLSKKDMERFKKVNPDIFDDNDRLRSELYVGKSTSELLDLEDKLRSLAKEVKQGVFKGQMARTVFNKLERANKKIERLQNEVDRLETELSTRPVTQEVVIANDYEFTINSDIPMPSQLKAILETSFTTFANSKVKFVHEESEKNMVVNVKQFFEQNAERLQTLTQQDVDDIIDYYANSQIINANLQRNDVRKYDMFKVYILSYFLQQSRQGTWSFNETQIQAINSTLDIMASHSASVLNAWRNAMDLANPNKVIIRSLAKSSGIEFREDDIDALSQALNLELKEDTREARKEKYKKIQIAVKNLQDFALKQYGTRKVSIFEKLVKFQRMAMLSSPGTWIRNFVSNYIVPVANKGGAMVGTIVTDKLGKHKKNIKGQWKISGTKVDSNINTYVDNMADTVVYEYTDEKGRVKQVTLFDAISDGLNKYDTKKFKKLSGTDALVDMIVRSIATDVFNANVFTSGSDKKLLKKSGEVLNTASQFLYKMLSDDPWIKKQTKYYLKRMIAESDKEIANLKLGPFDKRVSELLVEAYKMAAWDYMHKPNVFNKIEQVIRDRTGEAGYFVFKQILPFASASWNWFIAGLDLTPVGLVKGIIQYAKLENTIEKMDNARAKPDGANQVDSRFASYIARRNIGKGVIGTIGLGIGILLVSLGVAEIDDKDGKLKLGCNGFYVDISDLFGSQGILVGMAIANPFKNSDDGSTFWTRFGESFKATLNQLFNDSVYNDVFSMFEYTDSMADWFIDRTESALSMFVPNFIKTFNSMLYTHQIKYDKGILGAIEYFGVTAIPGLAYALPKKVDIYDGQVKSKYKLPWLVNFINRMSPIDVAPYNVTDMEKYAISLGVNKGELTGNYSDIGQLSTNDVQKLNEYYGKLNKDSLKEFINGNHRYKVQNEDGTYSELNYDGMTDKQRKSVIQRLMSDNAKYAKVYIWTSNGGKYYGSETEFQALKALGIKNVYLATDKRDGFI